MIFSPIPGISSADVTQGFGSNPQHYSKYGLNGHNGVDLHCTVGTPLYAPHEGYLHMADEGKVGYGRYVQITSKPYKDGLCRRTTLGHLSRFIALAEGSFVAAGDLVGISGDTGDSTGPHCHFGYHLLDEQGNVLNYTNGFHGALDISPFAENWVLGNLLRHP